MKNFIRINKLCIISVLICGIISSSCTSKPNEMVTPGEMKLKSIWVEEHLLDANPRLPFSFIFDGEASSELLKTWQKKAETIKLDDNRTQYTQIWTDSKTRLEVRCVAVEYSDFPAVEWTVYFKNTGSINSPNLKNIQGLDAVFKQSKEGEFVLHSNTGDLCREYSYEPHQKQLTPGKEERFAPIGGRSTNGAFPYYNVEMPGGGIIMAIGWPGQWACSFTADNNNGLHVAAGQELTDLYLNPGEEVRTPLIAILFWQGNDTINATNLWRRWYLAHNIPKIYGKLPEPIAQMQLAPTLKGNEAEQFSAVKKFADAGINIDLYWNDAGWYTTSGDWTSTGNWEADTHRLPSGFKPISERVHSLGKKLIVWFEPERVSPGTKWYKEFPEWILTINPEDTVFRRDWNPLQQIWVDHEANRNQIIKGDALFNLGDDKARRFLTDYISNFITDQGIDYYRHDFNICPLKFWRKADAPDRQGITENKYIVGLLKFWDELLTRHPGMLIDECASGGRRNDLECMRRAVPLTRSDFLWSWEGQQTQTYGISSWIPYYGSMVFFASIDKYVVRSFYMPSFGVAENQDMKKVKMYYDECRKIAPMMLGDYYPLTPYSLKPDVWIAWQFNRPEQGDGVIQAFRRDSCDVVSKSFVLSGLNPSAQYEVTNFDVKGTTKFTGSELMEKGLTVEIKDKPGAAVITYKELK
jgi:alpha-galactosidase